MITFWLLLDGSELEEGPVDVENTARVLCAIAFGLGRVLNKGFRGGAISGSGAVSDEELTDATLRHAR
jgi:hypothetical protein